jgi:hypothetical protein
MVSVSKCITACVDVCICVFSCVCVNSYTGVYVCMVQCKL